MPIGKSSIARMANNGYSNVKTEAPDMENSHIEEEEKKTVKRTAASKSAGNRSGAKKTTAKTVENTKKNTESSKAITADLKNAKTAEKANADSSASYVNLGGDMPYYLL